MKKFVLILLVTVLISFSFHAQDKSDLANYSFVIDDLSDIEFVSFTKEKLKNSQFVFIGEQHGIKEVGIFTNTIFNLAQDYEYRTLCIETDALAAKRIAAIAASENSISEAKKIHEQFPFAIPFYNNEDDYTLFKNVVKKNGTIWGIDQTFMAQFGFNFNYIINTSSNEKLKSRLIPLRKEAKASFKNAVNNKDFSAMYIFKYDEATHNELFDLSKSSEEKEIFHQLWKTKEIYTYNNTKQYYKNNNVRAQLMKSNFMRYYKAAQKKEKNPKVLFKLGANHAARGLTRTNIYDISNLGSELAMSNNLNSVSYIIMGISGEVAVGNPFAPQPTMPFDNIKQFPKEIQEVIPNITKKYYVLDLVPLRDYAYGKKYSEAFKKVIFGYDVIVLVNKAEAFKPF